MRASRVELGNVDVHSTVVGPVVGQCDNELESVLLCCCNNRVKARDTIIARVERGYAIAPELVVRAIALNGSDIIESPSTKEL